MRYELKLQKMNMALDDIDILDVSRAKGYSHSYLHGRLKHGFIYTVKGEMNNTFYDSNRVESQSVRVRAGELIFIPKGSSYIGTYSEDETEIRIVQFELASGELPDYLRTPAKIVLSDAEDEINAFFHLRQTKRAEHPFYFLSCLYRLFWKIDENRAALPGKYRQLQDALAEMNACPESEQSVAYYAALCHMSEVNFRRLFKQYTGMPPISYRNDVRLENAHAKLQSGEYNVSEAAEASGFSSLSFFIRLYKKKYGYTPTQR